MLGNIACFLSSARYFLFFFKTTFQELLKSVNSFDPGQARLFVGPDLALKLLVNVISRCQSSH